MTRHAKRLTVFSVPLRLRPLDKLIRETLLSSLELAHDILMELGYSPAEAQETVQLFRQHDEKLLARQHKIHEDEAQLIAASKAGAEELERLFGEDRRWPIA